MGLLGVISLCLVLIVGVEVNLGEAFRVSRQSNGLIVELLIVVDYSQFNKWYEMTSSSHSHSSRVQEATQKATEYASALVHSSNNVYKSLQTYNLNVQIKLVDVLVMTSPSQSPWTETVKVRGSDGYYTVDPDKALPLFQTKSASLQQVTPHDHAMILSYYDLQTGHGSTYSGYAYTNAECKERSVSIVTDNDDIYTAQLIAHEIGHSLGCSHDGYGNAKACPSGHGYAMEADFSLHNDKKWIFSTCSATAIKNYINTLNSHHQNCLQHIDNTHPDSQVVAAAHEWYGQIYSFDEQCKIRYGQNSYFCKNIYHGDLSTACLKMFCYKSSEDSCYYVDGGDGTPCGTGKWCMSNHCVTQTGTQTSPTTGTGTTGCHGDESSHCRVSDCSKYGSHKLQRCCATCTSAPIIG